MDQGRIVDPNIFGHVAYPESSNPTLYRRLIAAERICSFLSVID